MPQIVVVDILSPDVEFLEVLAVLDVRQGADGVHTRIDIKILIGCIRGPSNKF